VCVPRGQIEAACEIVNGLTIEVFSRARDLLRLSLELCASPATKRIHEIVLGNQKDRRS
jgi:hypothetical protein